ncbi:hypothetical protein BJY04DRAFT_226504 [Aspergillus karnatakaensis]|uniref:uncharacterized protein n=1 Tax=Aspergillus karnatakaensis TaxID=1810916 RepID=UPI003CCCC81D
MADTHSLHACEPCRASKLGCDKSRPHCMRCLGKGRSCNYAQPKTSHKLHASNHNTSRSHKAKRDLNLLSPQSNSSITQRKSPASTVKGTRNRIPKACKRCRQLKVRCDRKEPCSRCLRVDGGQGCTYPLSSPSVEGREPLPLWKQRFHSELHWSGLVDNIKSLMEHRRWPLIYGRHIEQENLLSSVDNIFGNTGPLYNSTRRTLLSFLPPKDVADSFVEHYLDIIEPSHQILDVPCFMEEINSFWAKPSSATEGWLAQFFVILALGGHLYNTFRSSAQHTDFGTLPARLFETAQVFLQRTAFMIRPDVTSIRTLCLFVIFKQMKGMICIESDALWPATGLIVRLSIMLGLHSSNPDHGSQSTSPVPIRVRNSLWAAVILLDLRQSLTAGMPVIPPSRDLIAEPLFGISHSQLPSSAPQREFQFPLVIYDILPQIFRVLELATSPQINLAYSQVTTYDRQIRGLLRHYRDLCFSASDNTATNNRFQWTMINVFFRRILLALHSRLYQEPQASTRYPVSYWSSLECSLALLSEQRELSDTASSRNGTISVAAASFFARLFQPEFFVGAVTLCFHLVQAHSPLVSPNSHKCQQGQARRTIISLLESCKDIWGCEKEASVCHSRSFGLLEYLLQVLEESGQDCDDGRDSDMGIPESRYILFLREPLHLIQHHAIPQQYILRLPKPMPFVRKCEQTTLNLLELECTIGRQTIGNRAPAILFAMYD